MNSITTLRYFDLMLHRYICFEILKAMFGIEEEDLDTIECIFEQLYAEDEAYGEIISLKKQPLVFTRRL